MTAKREHRLGSTGRAVQLLASAALFLRSAVRAGVGRGAGRGQKSRARPRIVCGGDEMAGGSAAVKDAPDVAIVSPYPALGARHGGSSGVASYAANLARSLALEGLRVAVVAPKEAGEPPTGQDPSAPQGRVAVHRSFNKGWGALPTAARAALATRAPVVHVQHEVFLYGGPGSVPGLIVALGVLRLSGRRTVVTLHQVVDPGSVDSGFTELHRVSIPPLLARAALALVQRALSGLAHTAIVLEDSFTSVVPGATTVPHGVEEVLEAPQDGRVARSQGSHLRSRLNLDEDALVVLCFGFIAPYKGLETALEAAAIAGPAVRLVVAGGEHPRLRGRDPYANELRDRYGKVASFIGYVPDEEVHATFASCDLALFTYPRPFSSSGALALALAHRTPLLVSPALGKSIGAPAELVCPTAPGELAQHLLELRSDRRMLVALGEMSHSLASGRSWRDVAVRHLSVYRSPIEGTRAVDSRTTNEAVVLADGRGISSAHATADIS